MTPKEAIEKALADGTATEGPSVRLPDYEQPKRPQGGCNGYSKKRKQAKTEKDKQAALFDKLCEAHGLPTPIHEYQFHHTRKWRFDYLFEDWLAVEKHGGVWSAGHHSGGQNQIDDFEKQNEAVILGYSVMIFTPKQFADGSAFAVIKRALEGE
jgi:hypothetical protein